MGRVAYTAEIGNEFVDVPITRRHVRLDDGGAQGYQREDIVSNGDGEITTNTKEDAGYIQGHAMNQWRITECKRVAPRLAYVKMPIKSEPAQFLFNFAVVNDERQWACGSGQVRAGGRGNRKWREWSTQAPHDAHSQSGSSVSRLIRNVNAAWWNWIMFALQSRS